LIVEVVSDHSLSRARVDRLEEYQVAGVRDYRIVDLRPNK
jgi:Uma2 family endonuclease